MPQYLLARHAHLCLTEEYAVVLDLRTDRYLALSAPQLRALARRVAGWPACEPRAALPTVDAHEKSEPSTILDTLVQSGILTTDGSLGRPATPVDVCPPVATLIDATSVRTLLGEESTDRARLGVREVVSLACACATAAAMLRWSSIERVADRVRVRKLRRAESDPVADLDKARDLVRAFRLLRPFFLAARQRCLLQSLALIEFMACYGIFPTWVFGVKSGPFAAHCWVQEQAVLFNDRPERVQHYTPIMAI